jgi:hypothetical protein
MKFVIASRHEAFGKMYLGKFSPVKNRSAALVFASRESAEARMAWWQSRVETDNLDRKFFGGMYVEEK